MTCVISNTIDQNMPYILELPNASQLNCSTLEGKVEFYEIDSHYTHTSNIQHIYSSNSTNQRISISEKTLKFSNLSEFFDFKK